MKRIGTFPLVPLPDRAPKKYLRRILCAWMAVAEHDEVQESV